MTSADAPRMPNDRNFYEITDDDLPLHCPLPGTSLWNSHPRVFLPLDEAGEAQCHYCGARFHLVSKPTGADVTASS